MRNWKPLTLLVVLLGATCLSAAPPPTLSSSIIEELGPLLADAAPLPDDAADLEAWSQRLQALNARIDSLDPRVRALTTALSGELALLQGHPRQAALVLRQAILAITGAFGPDHPLLADPLATLGEALVSDRLWEGAASALGRALELRTAANAVDGPAAARNVLLLATCFRELGDPESVILMADRAAQIFSSSATVDVLDRARLDVLRAQARATKGRVGEAAPIFEAARATLEDPSCSCPGERADATVDHADALLRSGQVDEALALITPLLDAAAPDQPAVPLLRAASLLARLHAEQGRGDAASTALEKGLELVAARDGTSSAAYADGLREQGLMLMALGRTGPAGVSFSRLRELWERLHRGDRLAIAGANLRLAKGLRAQGSLTAAEPRLLEALGMIEAVTGPEAIELVPFLDEVVSFYLQLERYTAATPHHQRALALLAKADAPDDPMTTIGHGLTSVALLAGRLEFDAAAAELEKTKQLATGLGARGRELMAEVRLVEVGLLKGRGEIEAAAALLAGRLEFDAAAAELEKTKQLATGLGARGRELMAEVRLVEVGLLKGRGEIEAAAALLAGEQAWLAKTYGEDSPPMMETLLIQAEVESVQRRFGNAIQTLERVLESAQRDHGEQDLLTLEPLRLQTEVLLDQGNFDRAGIRARELIELIELHGGRLSGQLLDVLPLLGEAEVGAGLRDAARQTYARGIDLARQLLGSDSTAEAAMACGMGVLELEEGDLEASQVRLDDCQRIRLQRWGAEHPRQMETFAHLGNLHLRAGRHHEALELLKKAVGMMDRVLSKKSPVRSHAMAHLDLALATAELRNGQTEKAAKRLKRAVARASRLLPRDDPELAREFYPLRADILVKMGKRREAAALLQKAAKMLQPIDRFGANRLMQKAKDISRGG